LYYKGRLPKGQLPPDICIEIALWDRFGWGPKETEALTLPKLRELFAILEQQRVSRDAIENLGPPDHQKHSRKMQAKAIEETQKRHQANEELRKKTAALKQPQTGTNQK
jgi:hypothetical protein